MKKTILTFTFLFITIIGMSQNFIDPDSILLGNQKVAKVLLVGSWHFNYPGLDSHKVEESGKINIYSNKRQEELIELIDYISRFKPTKVIVESGINTGYLIKNFKKYKKGAIKLYASERSQLGMRLVNKFKLDTVYGVNDWSMLRELNYSRIKEELKAKTYTDSIYDRHYYGGDDIISKRYSSFYGYKDSITLKNTLLEIFKYINSDKVLDRGFGAYIAGGQFRSKNNEGPDALSTLWINRNLRIYRNIQKINFNEKDRLVVIFGTGHISILKWLFECDPTIELVKFKDL